MDSEEYDEFRLQRLKLYPQLKNKVINLIKEIDTTLSKIPKADTESKNKLIQARERKMKLLKEYTGVVKYYTRTLNTYIESIDDDYIEPEEPIQFCKKISQCTISILASSDTFIKVRIDCFIKSRQHWYFTINHTFGHMEILNYTLPPFIPTVLNVEIQTGKFQDLDTLVKNIVQYLEVYTLRREHILYIKQYLKEDEGEKVEYIASCDYMVLYVNKKSDGELYNLEINFSFSFGQLLPTYVDVKVLPHEAGIELTKNLRKEIELFLKFPIIRAFKQFCNV